MMILEIGLVQASNSFTDACYLPYTAGLLTSYYLNYGRKREWRTFLDMTYRKDPVDVAAERYRTAHMVGFSVYVWNFRYSLKLAETIKRMNPDCLILFGGPHVPDEAEAFMRANPFVDLACHGEGEVVFTRIVDALENRDFGDIQSISYLKDGVFVHQPREGYIENLDTIPSPYLSGVFDDLMASVTDHRWDIVWETNRGCPFSCAYCDWGKTPSKRIHRFSMDRLEQEIAWVGEHRIRFIYCADSNFGILDRDLDLVKMLVNSKERCGYPAYISLNNTKNSSRRTYEIQKLLNDSALSRGITIGLQSIDPVVLRNIGRENISTETFYELQSRFNADGISSYVDLIIGLPGETVTSFKGCIDTLIEKGQYHHVQFNNLSILPNARMGSPAYQKKHGLVIVQTGIANVHGADVDKAGAPEEAQDLVVGSDTMPPEDWVKTRVMAWMASFLFFNKVLQVPMILAHHELGMTYGDMIEMFMTPSASDYPVLASIADDLFRHARGIQAGGSEYFKSGETLNVYWTLDEYLLIRISRNETDGFYDQSLALMRETFRVRGIDAPRFGFLEEAFRYNRAILKQPFARTDWSETFTFNIHDYYQDVLHNRKPGLAQGHYVCRIDRTGAVWDSWESWMKDVVWYENRLGAYTYPVSCETAESLTV